MPEYSSIPPEDAGVSEPPSPTLHKNQFDFSDREQRSFSSARSLEPVNPRLAVPRIPQVQTSQIKISDAIITLEGLLNKGSEPTASGARFWREGISDQLGPFAKIPARVLAELDSYLLYCFSGEDLRFAFCRGETSLDEKTLNGFQLYYRGILDQSRRSVYNLSEMASVCSSVAATFGDKSYAHARVLIALYDLVQGYLKEVGRFGRPNRDERQILERAGLKAIQILDELDQGKQDVWCGLFATQLAEYFYQAGDFTQAEKLWEMACLRWTHLDDAEYGDIHARALQGLVLIQLHRAHSSKNFDRETLRIALEFCDTAQKALNQMLDVPDPLFAARQALLKCMIHFYLRSEERVKMEEDFFQALDALVRSSDLDEKEEINQLFDLAYGFFRSRCLFDRLSGLLLRQKTWLESLPPNQEWTNRQLQIADTQLLLLRAFLGFRLESTTIPNN